MQNRTFTAFLTLAAISIIHSSLCAQQPVDTIISLKNAVQANAVRYHLLQSRKYEAGAAASHVAVTSYSRLPSIDASYQAGFGTANNLTGIFYPGNILPMTGPPSGGNNYSPATGSAASVLLNWQAVTFGQRDAQIAVSVADAGAQAAAYKQLAFGYAVNVISKYLDVLLAYDAVAVHQHNIERIQAGLHESKVLATTGIKPGVDTALFISELSKARIAWLKSQNGLQTERLLLGQLLVTDKLPLPSDSSFLEQLPFVYSGTDSSLANHPNILSAEKQIALNNAKETALKKSYLPTLNIWGTAFARGSGFLNDGSIKTWDGLGISRYNYGAGVQLAFPIMKYGEVKKQLQQQSLMTKAAEENLLERKNTLSTQRRIAATTFQNSIGVASEAGIQQKASLYAFNAMQIRYNTGLVNFTDLVQSQYMLLKAELDLKQAYWDAWKALLLQAAAGGDLSIFLTEIR
ncbi:TolC family protein [Sediminibacterium soli]|uniref:TolC family protein n=1 Tax=Sediminibacterium soli TaxID=2698829 RepID=UPI001379FA69|nr:TolC family protein [Sediminibacterium soli]NCI45048.1 TolC family protein [Sediminibacterium soli]